VLIEEGVKLIRSLLSSGSFQTIRDNDKRQRLILRNIFVSATSLLSSLFSKMQSYNTATTNNSNAGYNYNHNPQSSSYPQNNTNTTMSYSPQQQQQQSLQQQHQSDAYEDPRKPDSYSFGVTAERQEEPLREEKMYSEEDEWQPSAMMLCFLCWIVLMVAGGLAVGIYFANDRRGKNQPTIGPTLAPSFMPTMAPMICNICGDEDNGQVITNLVGFVDIPSLGGLSCRQLEDRGLNRNIPDDVCEEEVQITSVQDTCGCMVPPTPTPAPNESMVPTVEGFSTPAPNFVCPICGGPDFGITNFTGVIEFPGTGESLTCQQLQDRARDGQISPNICFDPDSALTNAVQLNCACVFKCNLCGTSETDGTAGTITALNGTITVAGNSRTCGELVELANTGQITEQQCDSLQPLALDPCQCVFTNGVL
jgi:hypothetical protein